MSAGTGPVDPTQSDGTYEADPMFWAVRPDDVPVLIRAYREAARQADQLAEALASIGLRGEEVVAVTAAVSLDGRPEVHSVLTLAGALRLAEFLTSGGAPPPGLNVSPPPDWAA